MHLTSISNYSIAMQARLQSYHLIVLTKAALFNLWMEESLEICGVVVAKKPRQPN